MESSVLPPVSSSFHHVRSEGRLARSTMKNRDLRMKVAMNNRPGKKQLQREKSIEHSKLACGWVEECDRLRADSGAEVHRMNQMAKERRQAKWNTHREWNANRECERWKKIDTARDKAAATAVLMAGTDRRNMPSVRYNLINHVYTDRKSAAEATFRDECTKYMATCRSRELMHRNNLSGYNILTGEDTKLIEVPPKPQKPE